MMIFQHTWRQVINGTKTQTRRLAKPGQQYAGALPHAIPYVYTRVGMNGIRKVYEVGKTYAVQPSRTDKSIARIRITNIRREDVRHISVEDAYAEGFRRGTSVRVPTEAICGFLDTWCHMHDPAFVFWFEHRIVDWMWHTSRRQMQQGTIEVGSWQSVLEAMKQRPVGRYTAWVLSFELVKEGGE